MENLPAYISILFGLILILTIYLFYRAAHYSRLTLWIIIAWVVVQSVISATGFYTVTASLPPRFFLLIAPPVLFILVLFFTRSGRSYIDKLSIKALTILHVIRIPVELLLFWLFLRKMIPGLMTFEGRNFDIISGITAPLAFYFCFYGKNTNRRLLLFWNFICLGLLINIVAYAVLSAPFPFQKLAFDQPNIAVLYFPFTLLPACIVPIVLFSHLASIRQLLFGEDLAKKKLKNISIQA